MVTTRRTDVLSPEQRRRCMSKVRSKNSALELEVRRALWGRGLRYRIGHGLPGRPDLVFVRQRLAVFVDSCFWHWCPKHGTLPKTRADFWRAKLLRNRKRDEEVNEMLRGEHGYRVLRIWEHDVHADLALVIDRIYGEICRRARHKVD
jgi:DNA mismatch endonuclease, patch repair protein